MIQIIEDVPQQSSLATLVVKQEARQWHPRMEHHVRHDDDRPTRKRKARGKPETTSTKLAMPSFGLRMDGLVSPIRQPLVAQRRKVVSHWTDDPYPTSSFILYYTLEEQRLVPASIGSRGVAMTIIDRPKASIHSRLGKGEVEQKKNEVDLPRPTPQCNLAKTTILCVPIRLQRTNRPTS